MERYGSAAQYAVKRFIRFCREPVAYLLCAEAESQMEADAIGLGKSDTTKSNTV